ncbi:hypothetical protein M378DRAFT_173979 [Amanita muscaria Koide BX008]|uniref:Cytochrome P450 n=1 Tax=Amanita muscaria (strain Koide BX008) TaxID=946122 RepID=A0A0C2W169_AMAMK|nr:hypothetical protein M378DRAFT_173979 [Amanita muscaria Koide BX008]
MMIFVAIHTTTMTFASLMYEVTKHQEYIQPLREEIETVIAGLVRKMRELESFIKHNGMTIPASSIVNVPYLPVHTDTGEEHKHQHVTAGVDYIRFGHGRHGCPGRFFVINEVKVLLARVLLKNDVKMADGP